jgi:recombination protein RecA
MFDRGISKEGSILDIGVDSGVIEKRGSFYSYGDTRLGQGRENAKVFLQDHADITAQIEGTIRGNMRFTVRSTDDSAPVANELTEADSI